jgi:hypothetical protein
VLLIVQAIANLITAVLVLTGKIPSEPERAIPQGEVI